MGGERAFVRAEGDDAEAGGGGAGGVHEGADSGGAMRVVGGDFNTRTLEETSLEGFGGVLVLPEKVPADRHGNPFTNGPRKRPYDRILTGEVLAGMEVPVELGGRVFENGLVFDSRVFEPLEEVAPVRAGDSGVKFMQHMAVVRDFVVR